MAPNLLHIVTGLQHEVQDGTGFEPPVALPLHNMGTIHCNNAHQLGVQLGVSFTRATGVSKVDQAQFSREDQDTVRVLSGL